MKGIRILCVALALGAGWKLLPDRIDVPWMGKSILPHTQVLLVPTFTRSACAAPGTSGGYPCGSAGAGKGCSGPLDVLAGANSAYGTRRLSSTYSGFALNATISGTPKDVGFSGCDMDTTLLASCNAAGACPVNTWYDQSGHNLALTGSGASRPSLIINQQAGHPTVLLAKSSAQFMSTTYSPTTSVSYTFFSAVNVVSAGTGSPRFFALASGATSGATGGLEQFIDNVSGNNWAIGQASKNGNVHTQATYTNPPAGNGFELMVSVADTQASCFGVAMNLAFAVFASCSSPATAIISNQFVLGGADANGVIGNTGDWNVAEFIVYASDQTASTSGVLGNLKGYWATP